MTYLSSGFEYKQFPSKLAVPDLQQKVSEHTPFLIDNTWLIL
jgi:hypothetical protein